MNLINSFALIVVVTSKCAFTVDPNDNPIETDQDPFVLGEVESCPFFNDQPVCCIQQQVISMLRNFKTIDATFGSDGGGCDICGSNMKRFWCHYTCHPNQREFLKVDGKINVTDPLDPKKILEVQNVILSVNPEVACEVFSSCKRTSFASQVSAMSTPGGFFKFQGENAITQGGQYIDVVYQQTTSIKFDNVAKCNQTYTNKTVDKNGVEHTWDDFGYEIKEQCGCNTCELQCDAEQILYEPTGIFYGFDYYYVLLAWSWAILFAIGITVYKVCTQKHATKVMEQI